MLGGMVALCKYQINEIYIYIIYHNDEKNATELLILSGGTGLKSYRYILKESLLQHIITKEKLNFHWNSNN